MRGKMHIKNWRKKRNRKDQNEFSSASVDIVPLFSEFNVSGLTISLIYNKKTEHLQGKISFLIYGYNMIRIQLVK